MTCRDMRDRVQAYADDELGTEGVLEVESHLARCASCRAAFERQRAFRRIVGSLYPQEEVPAAVTMGVHARLRARSSPGLLRVAVVAVAVAAIGATVLLSARSEPAMPAEVGAALGLHRAAESGALSLALESSSAAEVNRWLRSEVPFFTDVPEMATRGLAVRGAAAVQLAGARAGYVLYQDHARPISLFVLPRREWPPMGRAVRAGNVEFRWIETGGDRIVAWSHDPVSYLLVSDADRAPSEACGVCHANVGARGTVDLPADALHGGKPS